MSEKMYLIGLFDVLSYKRNKTSQRPNFELFVMKSPIPKILLGLCMALATTAWTQTHVPNLISVSQFAPESKGHKILIAAVKAANLDQVLVESGPFTVFAPSDAAFHKFSHSRMEELINASDKRELKSLLTYHIVAGQLTASDILRALSRGNGKTSFTTVQGKKLWAHMEGSDIVLTDPMGNRAIITTADLSLGSGVVHEIDRVIVPSQM